jgi:exopolyphosphatase/pppGpp-phosphohydrolase
MAELVALLELGSNAVRFVLARVKPGVGFRVLRQERTLDLPRFRRHLG